MGKNVLACPALKIEARSDRQEFEAGFREVFATLASQPLIQHLLHTMQMQNIGCGINELLVRQAFGAPIGRLPLLAEFELQAIEQERFQAMLIGIRPCESRRDFRAVNRACHDAESIHESCQIEPCEVKQLSYFFVRENFDEVGRAGRIRPELNDFRLAVSVGQLDKAEAIPRMVEPHGLGIHGDDFVRNEIVREIIDMKSVGQIRRDFRLLRDFGPKPQLRDAYNSAMARRADAVNAQIRPAS